MGRLIFVIVLLISHQGISQVLHDFNVASCSERSYPEYIRNRVIQRELKTDTLTVRLGLILNCCIEPEHRISYRNDSLFVQIDNVSDMLCMCECCFEITMTFTEFEDDSFQVVYVKPEINIDSERFETIYVEYPLQMSLEKYAFPGPEEFLAQLQSEEEINQFNEDSVKVGLWRRSSETYDYLIYYGENEDNSESEWRASFDKNGTLQEICGRDGLGESSCADRRDYFRLFLIADDFEEF